MSLLAYFLEDRSHCRAPRFFSEFLLFRRSLIGCSHAHFLEGKLLHFVKRWFSSLLLFLESFLFEIQDEGHGSFRWNAFTTNIFIANDDLFLITQQALHRIHQIIAFVSNKSDIVFSLADQQAAHLKITHLLSVK